MNSNLEFNNINEFVDSNHEKLNTHFTNHPFLFRMFSVTFYNPILLSILLDNLINLWKDLSE